VHCTDSMPRNDYESLDGQIQHKLAYITDFILCGKKLILIGHSIGCYVILKMQSKDTDNSLTQFCSPHNVSKCYLLFPTVEHIAQSPNGQICTPLLKYFRWMVPLITFPLLFLPYRIKRFLVARYFGPEVPHCAVEATIKLLSPFSCGNSAYLSSIEMRSIHELDVETVSENIERLCFYYGTRDAWCPIEYHHSMKHLFPSADIRLCSRDFEHAFVLKNSKEMASIVLDWLKLN